MLSCYECGKKLRFWDGYYHPTLGKKVIVCLKCFDQIEESMENYQNFIIREFKNERQRKIIDIKDIKLKFLNWWNHQKSTH